MKIRFKINELVKLLIYNCELNLYLYFHLTIFEVYLYGHIIKHTMHTNQKAVSLKQIKVRLMIFCALHSMLCLVYTQSISIENMNIHKHVSSLVPLRLMDINIFQTVS